MKAMNEESSNCGEIKNAEIKKQLLEHLFLTKTIEYKNVQNVKMFRVTNKIKFLRRFPHLR